MSLEATVGYLMLINPIQKNLLKSLMFQSIRSRFDSETSRSEQLQTQKGTREKPTQTGDDVMIQHSKESQQLTEQSRNNYNKH